MIVFEVFLNGRRVARAGAKDLGVLTTHVTAVGKLGPATSKMRSQPDIDLSVSGLTSRKGATNFFVDWLSLTKLNVGDEVRIHVSEAIRADKPRSRRNSKAKSSERQGSPKRTSPRKRG